MSITVRLKKFLEEQGVKPQQLAAQAGLKPAAVHKALSDGKGLRSDSIAAIMRRFPELDPDWLILGEGVMIRPAPREAVVVANSASAASLTPEEVRALRRLLDDQKQVNQKRASRKAS